MNLNRQCEKIIKELANGSKTALASLYNAVGRQMYVVAYNVLGDYQLSEDVIQESLITIYEKAGTLNDTKAAHAWLIMIVRNKALDVLRHRNHEVPTEDFAPYMPEYTVSDKSELSMDVQNALNQLSEDERQIVLMKTTMGVSHRDIANVLNMSVEACQKKYQRLLRRLKDYLK